MLTEVSSRWINFFRALLIAAATFLVFYPALHGAFLWDDLLYLPGNPLLQDPARLWKAWFLPGSYFEYYPLEQTVQWMQWRLCGSATFGYHVTNVLLHFVGALLVWRLLGKFGLRWAWVGGLLFAVHPLNVESVAYIAELKNTLSLPPFLLALCAYLDFEEHHRRRDYLLSLALFVVAMLCKITMAAFPFLILLYAWWKRGRLGLDDFKNAAPFLAISLILAATTIWAGFLYTQRDPAHLPLFPIGNGLTHLALAGQIFSFYFARFFWPVDPLPMYPRWNIDPTSPLAFLPWLVACALFFVLWRRRETWGRSALLGLGFFVLTLLPFSGLLSPSYMNFTWIMDHFLYIPLIGLIGLAVAGWERLQSRLARPFRAVSTGLISLVLFLLTVEAQDVAAVWTNPTTLWSYTLVHNPGAWLAHYNLANSLRDQGRFEEAISHYQTSIALQPGYDWTYNNLGLALSHFPERLPEAVAEYREALRLQPHSAEAHNNLANALTQMPGHEAEALGEYEAALRERPDFVAAHYNFGVALSKISGKGSEARAQFQDALRISPGFAPAQEMLDQLPR